MTLRANKASNLRKALKAVAERYSIVALYVFGSRALEITARVRGEPSPSCASGTDVDIGVQLLSGKNLSVREKVRCAMELEDVLGVSRVDLLVISDVNPFLALDIIRGELLYCHDFDEQSEYELHVLRRAADLTYYQGESIRRILSE
jgi:predicted nucleotidyltransferase